MELLEKPPPWLTDALPESVRDLLDKGGWWVLLGFAALVILLIVWALLSRLGSALFGRRAAAKPREELQERLADYPPPATRPGANRLIYEGLPVRLRLVVLASAGKEQGINPELVGAILDRVVPGLGPIARQDQARVRIWPPHLSYEGFAQTFHRNTPLPAGEHEPSSWIPLAGRAKLGGVQVLVGLGLWAENETTLKRRTLEPHEWALALRIKPAQV
jgi:hypothetical protein